LGEYIAVALDHLSTLDPFDLPKYDFKKIYLKLFAFGRPTQNKLQALLTEIENHYGKGLVPAFSWDTWKSPSLYHFLRVAKVSNTLPLIAHLVLLHYMGIAFPEALRLARGSSVWACPNKYCEDYQQLTLTEPKLIKTSLHMMCTTCDMKFSINGDTPIGDAPSQFRLIDPGPSFLASLKNEFKKGVNLAQASESSGIPEHLVVRIAHDAGIRESRRQRVESYYPGRLRGYLEEYRKEVSEWMEQNPCGSRMDLHRAHPFAYDKLRLHDSEWLNANAPQARPRGAKTGEKRNQKSSSQKD
jgi:hypothetical protein